MTFFLFSLSVMDGLYFVSLLAVAALPCQDSFFLKLFFNLQSTLRQRFVYVFKSIQVAWTLLRLRPVDTFKTPKQTNKKNT